MKRRKIEKILRKLETIERYISSKNKTTVPEIGFNFKSIWAGTIQTE